MPEKITNNADETTVQDLFDNEILLTVPYFQRPYKWQQKKIQGFLDDIIKLADEGLEDTHFVGAVITQGQQAAPAKARVYHVIDGQQRLTTMFLFLLGIVRAHILLGDLETAKGIFKAYIFTARDTGGKSNLKLQPSGADRSDLNDVVTEVLDLKNFRQFIEPDKVILLDLGGAPRSNRISKNFGVIKRILTQEVTMAEDKEARLNSLYTALLQCVTLVQIDIKDPLMGPVIFDRLNAGQEPMTVGELVKNDVLSRGSHLSDGELVKIEKELWQPFLKMFGEPDQKLFDTYLFPYGLIRLNPNVKKGDVYRMLRSDWSDRELSTEAIVAELSDLQKEFLDLIDGRNRSEFPETLDSRVKSLARVKLPTMMASFVMKVLYETRHGNVEIKEAEECLRFVESFIVRRAAFGLEPSGLHAAFKGMWLDVQETKAKTREAGVAEPSLARAFADSIGKRPTVKWPTAAEFADSLRTRSLYGSKVTRFILTEYNRHLPGDPVSSSGVEIEHILPQTMSVAWKEHFTDAMHTQWVNRLGNLTLLTEPMNKEVSNGGYPKKRAIYRDSKYSMTRRLAESHEVWTIEELENRTDELVNWALGRWPEE
jgi:hypothetical protein